MKTVKEIVWFFIMTLLNLLVFSVFIYPLGIKGALLVFCSFYAFIFLFGLWIGISLAIQCKRNLEGTDDRNTKTIYRIH